MWAQRGNKTNNTIKYWAWSAYHDAHIKRWYKREKRNMQRSITRRVAFGSNDINLLKDKKHFKSPVWRIDYVVWLSISFLGGNNIFFVCLLLPSTLIYKKICTIYNVFHNVRESCSSFWNMYHNRQEGNYSSWKFTINHSLYFQTFCKVKEKITESNMFSPLYRTLMLVS